MKSRKLELLSEVAGVTNLPHSAQVGWVFYPTPPHPAQVGEISTPPHSVSDGIIYSWMLLDNEQENIHKPIVESSQPEQKC